MTRQARNTSTGTAVSSVLHAWRWDPQISVEYLHRGSAWRGVPRYACVRECVLTVRACERACVHHCAQYSLCVLAIWALTMRAHPACSPCMQRVRACVPPLSSVDCGHRSRRGHTVSHGTLRPHSLGGHSSYSVRRSIRTHRTPPCQALFKDGPPGHIH